MMIEYADFVAQVGNVRSSVGNESGVVKAPVHCGDEAPRIAAPVDLAARRAVLRAIAPWPGCRTRLSLDDLAKSVFI